MAQTALLKIWSPTSDYQPVGNAALAANRDLRSRIEKTLDDAQSTIDQKIARANRSERTVEFHFNYDLGEKVFDRERTATIIRLWVWTTYRGRIGLDTYEKTFGGSMIRFCR